MSSILPVFAGTVDQSGRLTLTDPSSFQRHIQAFAGKPIELVVRQRRSHRSDRQNRYYWGVVIAILAEHLGYTSDEMHEALKWQFLRTEADDRPLATVKSTASLSTADFERYVEDVRIWAVAEFGCDIPLPNEAEAA